MKGRKPNITALHGALDKAPPAQAWLPKFSPRPGGKDFPKRAICFRPLVTARTRVWHSPSTTTAKQSDCVIARKQFRWRAVHVTANTLGQCEGAAMRNGTLGSITGRDEFIIARPRL
jgi:hypothetical protein